MIRFIKKLCKKNRFPILWTILSIALLCIPGSAIPGFGLFGVKHLDKIAHIILFGGIVFSWSAFAFLNEGLSNKTLIVICLITIGSVALGIIMEFIQFYFIPNRLFDTGDIWANFAGSVLALGLVITMRRKFQSV
jgi:glycopeptide antibiotics resistance protein